jgi:hypothetical protein
MDLLPFHGAAVAAVSARLDVLSECLGSDNESPALAEDDGRLLFSGVIVQLLPGQGAFRVLFSNVSEHMIEGVDTDQPCAAKTRCREGGAR